MISQQDAAKELLRRRHARSGICQYAEIIDVPGRPATEDEDCESFLPVESPLADHHKLILDEVEACFLKPMGRLMMFLPPGSAKSTYGSVVAPTYIMGKYKGTRCGLFSYASELAVKFGRRSRSVIGQQRYKGIFPGAELSADSKRADNFTLTNGSEYMATGILGGATGNRFEMLFVDDPVKGREQADSQTIRDKTWDSWKDNLLTRLVPSGSACIIQTRWNEDDLSGRILPDDWDGESGDILCKDGLVWRVLCIQAEASKPCDPLRRAPGEMLWTQWFTKAHWDQFRTDARSWGSLFQQIPKPIDGMMFKPDKINIIDGVPAGYIKWVRGWDLAATEGGGKYTVGTKLGWHRESGRLIIQGEVRGQWGPGNRDAKIKDAAVEDGRLVTQDIPDDPGAGGTAQTEYIVKALRGYPVVWGPESGDKATRAMPIAAEVNIGHVDMVRGDWNRPYKDELRSFPNGTYTDRGDSLSRAYARLFPGNGKITINKDLLNKVKK